MSTTRATPDTASGGRPLLSKVPEATAAFWIIKILTTGMGEVVADNVMERIGIPWTTAISGLLMAAALVWQFRATRYNAWPYWTAAATVSVFGTTLGDGPRRGLGLSFAQTSIVFGVVVVLALGSWYAVERTLSIHSIVTRRREAFYWVTVAATFALGTAVGDLFTWFGSAFLESALIFAALMAVSHLAHRHFRLNGVIAFWFAYVLTRPLGASVADWSWVPRPFGAGLGKDLASGITVVAFGVFLTYMATTRNGEPKAVRAAAV
jgi:uncharacterized membrane-anchored protein